MSPFTRAGLEVLAARAQLAERACHMTEGHPPHTWVAAPPQVPNPPFLWCPGKPCPDGKHRPDDDPTPGDRCKDCGRELTWRGPGPNDWDVVEPEPEPEPIALDGPPLRIGYGSGLASTAVARAEQGGDVARCPWCEGHPSPCADHRAEPEVTRYWLGTCPKDGVHIGIKTEGSDPDVPLVMRARDSIDSTCLCGTTLTLRLVARAEYEDVLGPDDDDPEDDDGPDDVPLLEDTGGAPYPDDVQRAHALALGPWLAACDAAGVPHDPDALIRHHRGNAALTAVCAATADELQAAQRRVAVAALRKVIDSTVRAAVANGLPATTVAEFAAATLHRMRDLAAQIESGEVPL